MKKENRTTAIWVCRVLVHVGIAGIVSGLLMIGYFLYKGNFTTLNSSFEASQGFYDAYDTMMTWAEDAIWIKNNVAPNGTIEEDRLMAVDFTADNGNTLTLHYRLGDINRWYMKGVTIFDDPYADYVQLMKEKADTQEAADQTEAGDLATDGAAAEVQGTDGTDEAASGSDAEATDASSEAESYTWLDEEYAPQEYGSLLEAALNNELTVSETSQLNRIVRDFIEDTGDRVSQFYQRKDQLDPANTNFRYFAQDEDGGIYTNMEGISTIEDAENAVINQADMMFYCWNMSNGAQQYNFPEGSFHESAEGEMWRRNWLSRTDQGDDWAVVTAVDTTYSAEDIFSLARKELDSERPLFVVGVVFLAVGGLMYLICFLYLTATTGWQPEGDRYRLYFIDRVNTEVSIVLFGVLALILLWGDYLAIILAEGLLYRPGDIASAAVVISGAAVASNLGLMGGWLSLVRRLKAGLLWKNSLCRKLCLFIKACWQERTITLRTGLCYVGFLIAHFFVYHVMDSFWLLLLLDIGVGAFLLWRAIQEQRVNQGIRRITAGEVDYKIDTTHLRGDYRTEAEAVNHIGEGLSNAVEKSLKNERLKTDLITNVSHDIKTPLTSIINYVDLLKRENIQDEKIRGYIDVLDKKSQRLKNLTEDLVEASKISSGNIKLEFMPIDFVQLIWQTNGEFEEKFAARGLNLVCSIPEGPIYVMADGRRLWRVVENLYNNTAKYALQDSRVYADLKADEEQVVFSLKNISEQPLNISADELTERFVRGDVSRTTEGSGLGLSIAQNLTTLQKGKFEIYLDGDLFRVTLTFPRVKADSSEKTEEAVSQENGENQEVIMDAGEKDAH